MQINHHGFKPVQHLILVRYEGITPKVSCVIQNVMLLTEVCYKNDAVTAAACSMKRASLPRLDDT